MLRLPFVYRYSRYRTRVLFFGSLLGCLLAVGIFLGVVTFKQDRSARLTFSVSNDALSGQLAATGMNVPVHSDNLLYNGDFDLPNLHVSYRLVHSQGSEVFALSEEDSPLSPQLFVGGQAEIISDQVENQPSSEYQVQSVTNTIYTEAQSLAWPTNLAQPVDWQAFALQGTKFYAVGSKRQLVSIDQTSTLYVSPSKDEIISLSTLGNGIVLLDAAGKIYYSEDLSSWQEIELPADAHIRHLVTENNKSNPTFIAVGDRGKILRGKLSAGEIVVTAVKGPGEANLHYVVANDNLFYLIGEDNTIWQLNSQDQIKILSTGFSSEQWVLADANQHTLLAVSQSGRVIVRQGNQSFRELALEQLQSLYRRDMTEAEEQGKITYKLRADIIACAVLSDQQWLLQDDRGCIYLTEDAGENWESIEDNENFSEMLEGTALDMSSVKIKRLNQNSVLVIDAAGQAASISSGLSIKLNSTVKSTNKKSEQILLRSHAVCPSFNLLANERQNLLEDRPFIEGEWYCSPDLEYAFQERSERINSLELSLKPIDKAVGSKSSINESDDSNSTSSEGREEAETGIFTEHRLADDLSVAPRSLRQFFGTDQLAGLKESPLYRLSFRARSLGEKSAIKIQWLDFATDITGIEQEIDNEDKLYSFNVVIPESATDKLSEDRHPSLQIELPEEDVVIDELELRAVAHKGSNQENSPLCLRFSEVIDAGYGWLSTCTQNVFTLRKYLKIEPQLSISDQLAPYLSADQSVPWLRLSSGMSESELTDLMAYLLSVDGEFAELRAQTGMSGNYLDYFPQLILEFTDARQYLRDDAQRRQNINRLINTLSRTPEYNKYHQRIILIDGMNYDNISLRTRADYPLLTVHTDAKSLIESKKRASFLPEGWSERQVMNNDYRLAILEREQSSTDFLSELSLALNLRGEYTYSELLPDTIATSAVSCLSELAGAHRLRVDTSLNRRYLEAEFNVSDDMPHLEFFAFAQNYRRVFYMLNHEENTWSGEIADYDLSGYRLRIYDAQGKILTDKILRQTPSAIEVEPGCTVCLSGSVQ